VGFRVRGSNRAKASPPQENAGGGSPSGGFTFCNQTGRPVIDVAVAYINTGMGRSIGWFHINNGDCRTLFLITPVQYWCFLCLLRLQMVLVGLVTLQFCTSLMG